MSSKVANTPVPFEIPLSDEDIILLGKIAVLWGQVDEALNQILQCLLRLSPAVFNSLMGNQMTGSRVEHLKSIAETCARQEVRDRVLKLHRSIKDVLPRRNAAMHGCWGYYVEDPTFKNLKAGTFNHQKPKERFFAPELARLYDDLCRIVILLNETLMYSVEENPTPIKYNGNKIFFAPQPPDKRSHPIRFKPGDRVVYVESKSRGWTNP